MRSFTLSLMLLMASATQVHAASPSTPESVVEEYSAALNTEGMASVSKFMHSAELDRFKTMLMPMLRKDAAGKNEVIPGLFGPEASLASVEAMSPAGFMDSIMLLVGDKLKGASFGDAEILGTVKEKDVVHVVARLSVKVQEIELKTMQVISTRRDGDQWKLLLTGAIEGLMAALSK